MIKKAYLIQREEKILKGPNFLGLSLNGNLATDPSAIITFLISTKVLGPAV